MGLEAGTYISDLNSSNPTSGDSVSQADDHIRLLKSTIQATFPNVAGAVTATHAHLNGIPGVGQTWQNVAASRAINTNYTNSTDKAITVAVSVSGNTPSSTVSLSFVVDGVTSIGSVSLIAGSTPASTTISSTTLVPPGSTYRASVTQGTISSWVELR